MIVNERMNSFINSFAQENPSCLEELEREARKTNVPIIRTEMQSLMKFLLELHQPHSILEVGSAIGFSALLMKEYAPADCRITTIEKYEKRIPIARENFRKMDPEGQITLLEGDAAEILKTLSGQFDFVFMDAAKGQYLNFLPDLLRMMRPGALLVSDNVLQDGNLIESRYAVNRRDRTIHSRMREYLYTLTHMPELQTTVLTVGDGVTLSVRKEVL